MVSIRTTNEKGKREKKLTVASKLRPSSHECCLLTTPQTPANLDVYAKSKKEKPQTVLYKGHHKEQQ